jgi:hypothetical protein
MRGTHYLAGLGVGCNGAGPRRMVQSQSASTWHQPRSQHSWRLRFLGPGARVDPALPGDRRTLV